MWIFWTLKNVSLPLFVVVKLRRCCEYQLKTGAEKDWNILYREQSEVRTWYTCFFYYILLIQFQKVFRFRVKRIENKTDRKITTLHSSVMFLFSLSFPKTYYVCVPFCIIKSIESPTNYINKLYFISLTLLFVIHSIRLAILFWTSKVHRE